MEIDISKIKVIFLDIGGVMLSNGWGHASREEAARKFGLDYVRMEDLHQFINNVFEIGAVSLDGYLDTVVFSAPRDFTKEEFKEFMFEQSVELPNMLSWLKEWKQHTHFPVFALNNESREINDYRLEAFSLHKIFDGFCSSFILGFRKPDPRIFRTAMAIAQAKPAECLYFDDRPRLVETAKQLGIRAIVHENFQETKRILEQFMQKQYYHD